MYYILTNFPENVRQIIFTDLQKTMFLYTRWGAKINFSEETNLYQINNKTQYLTFCIRFVYLNKDRLQLTEYNLEKNMPYTI